MYVYTIFPVSIHHANVAFTTQHEASEYAAHCDYMSGFTINHSVVPMRVHETCAEVMAQEISEMDSPYWNN